jgi:membrane protein implicated in regulation of membrane protease activity
MVLPPSATLIVIPLAFAGGVILLTRAMRRMRARAQFLVLLVLGLSVGFTFLVMVQMPDFPHWLGISLVVVVFTASPFATRSFLRSVKQEEEEREREESGLP